MADFDLGGLLFGNAPSIGLEGYLDPEQLKRMQQQGVMQAAMALLKASGPSTQRVGLGQALGGAYEAGQAGYQQAQQQGLAAMMTKQKLDEAKRAQQMQENYAKMVAGLTGGEAPGVSAMTPESALAAPVTAQLPAGPTIARSEMIGQPTRNLGGPAVGGAQMPRSTLTPQMATLLSQMTPKEGIQKLYELSQPPKTQGQPFKAADGNYYIQTENGGVIPAPIAPADLGAEEYGAPVAQVVNGQIQMVQYNKKGDSRVAQNTMPYEPQSPDIRSVEYLLGKNLGGTGTAGMGQVGEYRRTLAPITKVNVPVDMTGGQKGFENEMSLGKAFKAEPIYKDYNDMQSAYGQVVSSLKQGTPIGDVAGATKVMKLLDPGSVVRESELGIAMAAAGRMDRLQNYFSNMMSGQKLTPTQRDDFQSLSNELYAAAGQAYNKKRQEYEEFGTSYGFKNLGTALGKQAQVPSLMRGGPGSAERKPLGSIFQPR
ncbi:hypothetical protein UFOVP377_30 [uncultured Caudovirales phage]|uniref:Uncharacterized protein n=1 Tax=uncultured Caudovirales phage TaxID=2100421 RepID=A0A6J7WY73_9CAUD|nr:hypothetical protein UFOVP377_30 [uncultured Caudovirales phage]